MFKNKKIKKLFSVICTVLTLNSTSSIFQHNPSAIKFETTKDGDGWESTSVTLDKPFHCIVVYDQEEILTHARKAAWPYVPLNSLLFETVTEEEAPNITTLHVSTQQCIDTMKQFLYDTPEDNEVLIVVCLNCTSSWNKLPALPYSYMMGTQRGISRVIETLPQNLDDTPLRHLVFSQDGTPQLTTLELLEHPSEPKRIRSYEITTSGTYRKNYDSFVSYYETRPDFWHLKAPGRIMNVRELKNWLATHNPDLLNQASRTTNTISHPSTNQTPRSNENHINPPPALHNDENEAHDNSSFTPANEYNFELDDFDIPIVTDFVDASNQRTNVFSKTKKFVHKNPKTSVGLGATIVALGGTVIYTLKKLFTRQTKRSQTKNQLNQKYNQHVKNKV